MKLKYKWTIIRTESEHLCLPYFNTLSSPNLWKVYQELQQVNVHNLYSRIELWIVNSRTVTLRKRSINFHKWTVNYNTSSFIWTVNISSSNMKRNFNFNSKVATSHFYCKRSWNIFFLVVLIRISCLISVVSVERLFTLQGFLFVCV